MEAFLPLAKLLILPIACVFVIVLFALVKKPQERKPTDTSGLYDHYRLRDSMFSKSEQALDVVLRSHLPPNTYLHGKVRYIDINRVEDTNQKLERNAVFGLEQRIKPRHSDWAVCDADGRYLCLIELDDKSHNTAKAKKADAFKNALAQKAGLPLHRVRTGTNYKRFAETIAQSLDLSNK